MEKNLSRNTEYIKLVDYLTANWEIRCFVKNNDGWTVDAWEATGSALEGNADYKKANQMIQDIVESGSMKDEVLVLTATVRNPAPTHLARDDMHNASYLVSKFIKRNPNISCGAFLIKEKGLLQHYMYEQAPISGRDVSLEDALNLMPDCSGVLREQVHLMLAGSAIPREEIEKNFESFTGTRAGAGTFERLTDLSKKSVALENKQEF